jgi:predicted enzyme related to lactoylglutathione lyase
MNATHFIQFLPTPDLATTARFYEDVIGLELIVDQGTCRIYRVSHGGFIGFCQNPHALPNHDGLILTFVLDDVDGTHTRLSDLGLETDGPPRENPRYRIYHFFARDPNGYRLEVQRFLHAFP